MLRRIWEAIKEASTPHWDADSAELSIFSATVQSPGSAAPIQAAADVMRSTSEDDK